MLVACLQTQQAESLFAPPSQMSGGFGDVRGPCHPEQADGEVAQGGHDLRSAASADLRAVFVEGDVTNEVDAVFDLPVTPDILQQVCGRGLLLGEAGHPVDHLMATWFCSQVEGDTLDAEDLFQVGEVEVAVQLGAGPDPAGFDPAMTLVEGFMLRGEKPRCRGFVRPSSVSLLVPRS